MSYCSSWTSPFLIELLKAKPFIFSSHEYPVTNNFFGAAEGVTDWYIFGSLCVKSIPLNVDQQNHSI